MSVEHSTFAPVWCKHSVTI